jgi:hypothetical protein
MNSPAELLKSPLKRTQIQPLESASADFCPIEPGNSFPGVGIATSSRENRQSPERGRAREGALEVVAVDESEPLDGMHASGVQGGRGWRPTRVRPRCLSRPLPNPNVIKFSDLRNANTPFETAPRPAPPQDERLVGLIFIQRTLPLALRRPPLAAVSKGRLPLALP